MMEYDEEKREKKATILVVDDSPLAVMVYSHILEEAGYAVVSAKDSESGWSQYKRTKPDLVLTDLVMPTSDNDKFASLSGLNLLSQIRKKDSSTPVIVITGIAMDCLRQAIELGADRFMVKPFEYCDLLNSIEELLSISPLKLEACRLRNLVSVLKKEIEQLYRNRKDGAGSEDADKHRPICGSVAHSLKNEFLNIGTSIKDIRELASDSPDIQEECDIIERSVEYSQLHLQRLLDYLDMGKPSVEPIDVLELLRRTELLARPRLLSNVQLEIDIDSNIKGQKVSANFEQLMGGLFELINNATNALREKGGTIRLHLEERNGEMAISVKDDGPGIPEEIRKELFKKQVLSKRGLGLGLFFCNKVISALGGKLNLETSSEEGTEITILLPVANDEKEL